MRATAASTRPMRWGVESTEGESPVTQAEGDEDLSDSSSSDPLAKAGRGKSSTKRPRKSDGPARKTGDVGRALRSVYDKTLREDVPQDFLDLLGKLD